MSKYLPVVQSGIPASIEREIFDKFDEPYIKEQLKILGDENPVIAQWLKSFSKTTKDRTGAIFSGLIVYKLLESQAEADRMEEEINLG